MSHNVRKHTSGHGRPANIQIIRAVWSESSLGAFWIGKDTPFYMWIMKYLTILRGCTGGLESLLGANVGRYVCIRCDSNVFLFSQNWVCSSSNIFLTFSPRPVERNVKEYNGSSVNCHRMATATSMFWYTKVSLYYILNLLTTAITLHQAVYAFPMVVVADWW